MPLTQALYNKISRCSSDVPPTTNTFVCHASPRLFRFVPLVQRGHKGLLMAHGGSHAGSGAQAAQHAAQHQQLAQPAASTAQSSIRSPHAPQAQHRAAYASQTCSRHSSSFPTRGSSMFPPAVWVSRLSEHMRLLSLMDAGSVLSSQLRPQQGPNLQSFYGAVNRRPQQGPNLRNFYGAVNRRPQQGPNLQSFYGAVNRRPQQGPNLRSFYGAVNRRPQQGPNLQNFYGAVNRRPQQGPNLQS
eukprot:773646-Pelagomonas_calceolata.AAC.3